MFPACLTDNRGLNRTTKRRVWQPRNGQISDSGFYLGLRARAPAVPVKRLIADLV